MTEHKHDMKDLERRHQITMDDEIHSYDIWCCFDRDCNYHEFRVNQLQIMTMPEEITINDLLPEVHCVCNTLYVADNTDICLFCGRKVNNVE